MTEDRVRFIATWICAVALWYIVFAGFWKTCEWFVMLVKWARS